jgi:hypothetical protein
MTGHVGDHFGLALMRRCVVCVDLMRGHDGAEFARLETENGVLHFVEVVWNEDQMELGRVCGTEAS